MMYPLSVSQTWGWWATSLGLWDQRAETIQHVSLHDIASALSIFVSLFSIIAPIEVPVNAHLFAEVFGYRY